MITRFVTLVLLTLAWVAAAGAGVTEPARGGTLRVGIVPLSTLDALDPAMVTTPGGYAIARQLFDTLTEFGTDGRLRLRLAQSIVPNGTGDDWTVTLRSARWQDGAAVTAEDVIFTLQRILDPRAPLPPASSLPFVDPGQITQVDEHTVRFHLRYPTMAFAESFASPALAIVPRHFDAKHPVGSGPFRLETLEPGSRVSFLANRLYWNRAEPYVDRLLLIGFPDSVSEVNALLAGQIDVASSIDPILAPLLDRAAPRVKRVEYPTSGTLTWQMNIDRKPFDDVRVRQALRLAVDRQQIIDQVYDGHATLGNDIFSPYDNAYTTGLPQRHHDAAAAKRLLAEAGYPRGLTVVLTTAPIQPTADRQNEVLLRQAEKAGFHIVLRRVDTSTYYGDGYGTYPLSLSFWGQLGIFEQAAFTITDDAPYDATHWHDAEYDALYKRAMRTVDQSERVQLVHQMQAIEYERGPYVVGTFVNNVSGYGEAVTGYRTYPNCDGANGYNFGEIGFKPELNQKGRL